MDILASILAYLGCVTGIVGALAISSFVFFSAPSHQIIANSTLTTAAKPAALKTADAAEAKSASASHVAKVEFVPAPKIAADTRPVAHISPAPQTRRLVREERARRFAYQQDPTFEARFLSHAD
jgi:hypothetical protein